MREVSRNVVPDGAGMALEVVADLLTSTAPEELAGYVVVGLLRQGGFKISSNATCDEAEIVILERVLAELREAAQPGGEQG